MKTTRRTTDQFIEAHGAAKLKKQEREIARLQATIQSVHRAKGGKPKLFTSSDNTINFGVCSDLHFGSLYEASLQLQCYAQHCADAGIMDIFVAGDILAGWKVYKGQEFELAKIGFDQQLDHFAKTAPNIPRMKWHFITGNHDESFKKLAGVNVGAAIQEARKDWHFLGEMQADFTFNTPEGMVYKVRLLHPDGGASYALSHRPQRISESISGGSKPHMLAIGHYHKSESIPNYRNIHLLQPGCFEWQTPFLMRKGSSVSVGGYKVKVCPGDLDTLANTVQTEFVGFY